MRFKDERELMLFLDGPERETKEKGLGVINMGCNQGVNKN